MKKCNKECKYFMELGNTDECGEAICSYVGSYFPVKVEKECCFLPKEYTCKDCDHFENDYACIDCEADDPAMHNGSLCWGFIDKKEIDVYNALCDWSLRGFNIEDKLNKILEEFHKEFKPL